MVPDRCESRPAPSGFAAILPPVCAVLLVLLSACGAPADRVEPAVSRATVTPGVSDPRLDGTRWRLTEMNGRGSLRRSGITLEFDRWRMLGESGCNRYGVDYSAHEGRLALAEGIPRGLLTTDAYCGPGLMRREDAYQNTLRSAKGYRLAGERLELMNADGETILPFERMAEQPVEPEATGTPSPIPSRSELDGTYWLLTAIEDRKPLPESGITLEFGGGRMFGESGCNRYQSEYTARRGVLALAGHFGTTTMYCTPRALRLQENVYQGTLHSAAGYRLDDDRLELTNEDGGTTLMFERIPPPPEGPDPTSTPAR